MALLKTMCVAGIFRGVPCSGRRPVGSPLTRLLLVTVLLVLGRAFAATPGTPGASSEGSELQAKGGIMTLMDVTPDQPGQGSNRSPAPRARPRAGDGIVLKNRQVSLTLDRTTFALVSMRDERLGIEYVAEPGSPLCEIQLVRLPNGWYENPRYVTCDGVAAKTKRFKFEKSAAGEVLVLSYLDCPTGTQGGAIDLEIRISLAPRDTVFRWNLAVKNRSGMTLANVLFPTAGGLGSSTPGSAQTDSIVRAMTSGCKIMKPREKQAGAEGDSESPASTMSLQAIIYSDGQTPGGLYLAAEDAKWFRKNFICTPSPSRQSFSWHFTHFADGREKNQDWTLPYTVAFGPFRGDWYDAAKEYRKWIQTQPVFVPLKKRTDTPAWFSRNNVWFQGQDIGPESNKMSPMLANLLRIRQELGEEYGWHWYLWQKGRTHDHNYPDYFPAAAGFRDAVKTIQAAGVHAMPYINVSLYETQLKMWEDEKASQWAVRNGNYGFFDAAHQTWSRGDLEWVFYMNSDQRKMVAMCPATAYWQDKMAGLYGRLLNEDGLDAVYLDQLMVYPYLCYAANHGHAPAGGGDHVVQGFREMIKKIRASTPKKFILGGENIGEPYTDVIDYQLTAHSECAPDRIPMYQAALKDYTVEIGLYSYTAAERTPEAFMAKQGLCFVQGRQLGWFNFNNMDFDYTTGLLKPDALWFMPYLKTLCAARTAARDFLVYGELLRPPLLNNLPNKNVRWILWPNGNPAVDDRERSVPVVWAQAYKSPAGDLGLVLANWTDQDRQVTLTVNRRDWGIAVGTPCQVRTWSAGAWHAPARQILGAELTITVPKLSPVILRVSPDAPPQVRPDQATKKGEDAPFHSSRLAPMGFATRLW